MSALVLRTGCLQVHAYGQLAKRTRAMGAQGVGRAGRRRRARGGGVGEEVWWCIEWVWKWFVGVGVGGVVVGVGVLWALLKARFLYPNRSCVCLCCLASMSTCIHVIGSYLYKLVHVYT